MIFLTIQKMEIRKLVQRSGKISSKKFGNCLFGEGSIYSLD